MIENNAPTHKVPVETAFLALDEWPITELTITCAHTGGATGKSGLRTVLYATSGSRGCGRNSGSMRGSCSTEVRSGSDQKCVSPMLGSLALLGGLDRSTSLRHGGSFSELIPQRIELISVDSDGGIVAGGSAPRSYPLPIWVEPS